MKRRGLAWAAAALAVTLAGCDGTCGTACGARTACEPCGTATVISAAAVVPASEAAVVRPAPAQAPAAAEKDAPEEKGETVATHETGDAAGDGVPTQEDLLHRRFVLVSVDGEDFPAGDIVPDIEFNEGFRVSGRTCNRYMGPGKLENGVLTVERMASTMMMCAQPELNELERRFSSMLNAGAEITLVDNILTLKQGGHTLVYKAADWVR